MLKYADILKQADPDRNKAVVANRATAGIVRNPVVIEPTRQQLVNPNGWGITDTVEEQKDRRSKLEDAGVHVNWADPKAAPETQDHHEWFNFDIADKKLDPRIRAGYIRAMHDMANGKYAGSNAWDENTVYNPLTWGAGQSGAEGTSIRKLNNRVNDFYNIYSNEDYKAEHLDDYYDQLGYNYALHNWVKPRKDYQDAATSIAATLPESIVSGLTLGIAGKPLIGSQLRARDYLGYDDPSYRLMLGSNLGGEFVGSYLLGGGAKGIASKYSKFMNGWEKVRHATNSAVANVPGALIKATGSVLKSPRLETFGKAIPRVYSFVQGAGHGAGVLGNITNAAGHGALWSPLAASALHIYDKFALPGTSSAAFKNITAATDRIAQMYPSSGLSHLAYGMLPAEVKENIESRLGNKAVIYGDMLGSYSPTSWVAGSGTKLIQSVSDTADKNIDPLAEAWSEYYNTKDKSSFLEAQAALGGFISRSRKTVQDAAEKNRTKLTDILGYTKPQPDKNLWSRLGDKAGNWVAEVYGREKSDTRITNNILSTLLGVPSDKVTELLETDTAIGNILTSDSATPVSDIINTIESPSSGLPEKAQIRLTALCERLKDTGQLGALDLAVRGAEWLKLPIEEQLSVLNQRDGNGTLVDNKFSGIRDIELWLLDSGKARSGLDAVAKTVAAVEYSMDSVNNAIKDIDNKAVAGKVQSAVRNNTAPVVQETIATAGNATSKAVNAVLDRMPVTKQDIDDWSRYLVYRALTKQSLPEYDENFRQSTGYADYLMHQNNSTTDSGVN